VRALTGQGFQLDAAACQWNAKCPIYFDERMDAFRQNWSRYSRIFCNAPFNATLIAQFVHKALEAAATESTVVLLLPLWPGYPWFHQLKRRGQLQDIITPVSFEERDGRTFLLNKGSGTHLVAVTLGPKITPRTNAEAIQKRPMAG
jgi:hypothetical protein